MAMGKSKLLEDSLKKLKDCSETLEKISSTCCMPERSGQMTEAFETIQKAVGELEIGRGTPASINKCIAYMIQLGSQIGKLYVSCCTETREHLYQHLLQQLNKVHETLGRVSGLSH